MSFFDKINNNIAIIITVSIIILVWITADGRNCKIFFMDVPASLLVEVHKIHRPDKSIIPGMSESIKSQWDIFLTCLTIPTVA